MVYLFNSKLKKTREMTKIIDIFLSLDSFGQAIDLNFKGKTKFSTICGSLISALVYIVLFLYSIEQLIIFYNKEDI